MCGRKQISRSCTEEMTIASMSETWSQCISALYQQSFNGRVIWLHKEARFCGNFWNNYPSLPLIHPLTTLFIFKYLKHAFFFNFFFKLSSPSGSEAIVMWMASQCYRSWSDPAHPPGVIKLRWQQHILAQTQTEMKVEKAAIQANWEWFRTWCRNGVRSRDFHGAIKNQLAWGGDVKGNGFIFLWAEIQNFCIESHLCKKLSFRPDVWL